MSSTSHEAVVLLVPNNIGEVGIHAARVRASHGYPVILVILGSWYVFRTPNIGEVEAFFPNSAAETCLKFEFKFRL